MPFQKGNKLGRKFQKEQSKYGEESPNWKGGRRKHREGYIRIFSPTHPNKDCDGYIFEHRLVIEKHIGRTLLKSEVVHHINSNHSDNRIENLMLFNNNGEHIRLHNYNKK